MSERLLPDWLGGWQEYQAKQEPCHLFKVWAGISTIAAVLQRKCYSRWETYIYPNLYVILVGPSASRKGTAMGPAMEMLNDLGIRLAPQSITREALIRFLRNSTTEMILEEEGDRREVHTSLTVFAAELSVFLGFNRPEFMMDLIDLYDCAKIWRYYTKNKGDDEIHGVWLNMLGATTPSSFQDSLPSEAVGTGFTSRIIIVYGDHITPNPLPILTEDIIQLRDDLAHDLEQIYALRGEFKMTPQCLERYSEWYIGHTENGRVVNPNLEPYYGRKATHLRKLSMIMSASRSDEMVITLADFDRAKKILEHTEPGMIRCFYGYGHMELSSFFPRVLAYINITGPVTYPQLLGHFHLDIADVDLQNILKTLNRMGKISMDKPKGGELEFRMMGEL
jgi:hypothetical protein